MSDVHQSIDEVRLDDADAEMLFDNEPAQTTTDEGKSADPVKTEEAESVEGSEVENEEGTDEGVEEPVFTLDGEDYKESELQDAVKDRANRKEWQSTNTQKAQDLADQRRSVEPLVQLLDRFKGNDEFRTVMADAIEDELGEDARKEFENALSFDPEKAVSPYKKELDQAVGELEAMKADQVVTDAKALLKQEYKLKKVEVEEVYEHALDVFEKTGRILTLDEAYKQTPIYIDRIKQEALREAGVGKKPMPPTASRKSRGAAQIKKKSPKITDYEQISAEGYGLFE